MNEKKPRPNSRKKRRERYREAWAEVETRIDEEPFSPASLHLQAATDMMESRLRNLTYAELCEDEAGPKE